MELIDNNELKIILYKDICSEINDYVSKNWYKLTIENVLEIADYCIYYKNNKYLINERILALICRINTPKNFTKPFYRSTIKEYSRLFGYDFFNISLLGSNINFDKTPITIEELNSLLNKVS